MATFLRRIYDPEVGSGAVDVYAMMFACQFIIFIIIVFSWSAFSSSEVRNLSVLMKVNGINVSGELKVYQWTIRIVGKVEHFNTS